MRVQELQQFTSDIAGEFNRGEIRHPVHLSDGNEEQLIEIFEDINEDDWVCGSWRMHYQCLLKGVPSEKLKEEIRRGNSMTLSFPEHRVISSAIVGGILPIALGIALSLKETGREVFCFLGDMTANTGIFYECVNFAQVNNLPIHWIIEDNGVSVCTPTIEVCGEINWENCDGVEHYTYKSKYPHAGAGIRVQF